MLARFIIISTLENSGKWLNNWKLLLAPVGRHMRSFGIKWKANKFWIFPDQGENFDFAIDKS